MKRILSLLLAVVMVLSMTGCTGDSGETQPSGTQATTAPTTGTTVPSNTTVPTTEQTAPPTTEQTTPPTTEQTAPPTTEPTAPSTQETEPPTTAVTQPPATDPKQTECAHQYKSKTTKRATCAEEGIKTYTCSRCGDSYETAIAAKGHSYEDATCTNPKTCSTCGETEGKALGHNYVNWQCTRCGKQDSSKPSTYTVSINAKNGKPLENVTVKVYSDDTLTELVASGVTDKYGIVTLEMATRWTYHAVLSGYSGEYTAANSYFLYSDDYAITLSGSNDLDFSGTSLKKGKYISDFTVYDVDGERYTLSDLFKTKQLVILNFWYCSCVPCKAEFPHMNSVYEEYGDKIEILAMDHYDSDSLAEIRALREDMGISFPMIKESLGFGQAFNITGYPTTVIIDSTGLIQYVKTGGFSSEQEFIDLLEDYLN